MTFRLVLAALAAAALPAFAAELPASIRAELRKAELPDEAVGVIVQRSTNGGTLFSLNPDKGFAPGSTMKLLTALAALEMLGPAYRGSAEFRARAEPVDGVLDGDLVLKGLGSVDLDVAAFERMIVALRVRGVREIRGDLILDRTFFDPPRTDVGLPPFDEAPEFRYNYIPDALMLNANLMHLELASGENSLRVGLGTPLDRLVVNAENMRLTDKPCEDWEDFWKHPVVQQSAGVIHVRLQGEFPRKCTGSTNINVIDRVAFADRLFRALWTRHGGTLAGKVCDAQGPADTIVLATHHSRPFSQVLHDINKVSDNPVTRVAYLTLGAFPPYGPALPTAERSERFLREWMTQRGIDHEGMVLENGSGLSRKERIKVSQLAAILRAGASSVWAADFLASLPITGVDGTMRMRLRDVAVVGEGSRFKTGTLKDTSAVAGYVRSAAGEQRVVVVVINHERANRAVARPIIDNIVEWAATLK